MVLAEGIFLKGEGAFAICSGDHVASSFIAFAKEDVITSSGNLYEWDTPSVDLGGDFTWSNGAWE